MEILKPAKAGTLESNDISIMLMPYDNGIEIELDSVVEKQFGVEIRETIKNKLEELGVKDALVKAIDKGALDYTIRARIEIAVIRAGEKNA
ncbi:MAG: citrate lyase acyl carrier protein [Fusobacteria bacterium]|nr:MAG: citrate lyase acyl carrier protein [Fusobacteriota bacterium]